LIGLKISFVLKAQEAGNHHIRETAAESIEILSRFVETLALDRDAILGAFQLGLKREKILADPEKYRQDQILKRVPDDFDDLTEEEQESVGLQVARPAGEVARMIWTEMLTRVASEAD
jgi:hypothetical protein